MKLVILDGYMATREDLNWNSLSNFTQVEVFDRTPPEKIIERSIDADAVFTNKVPFFKEQIDQLPKLKYIGVLATGYNNVDLQLTRERGIVVSNIPAYGTNSVTQEVFAHILNISNRVELHSNSVHVGDWCKSPDICYCLTPQTELANRTLGIIGFGAIGQKVAQIAEAFDMQVLAYSPSKKKGDVYGKTRIASIDEIFAQSDIISLNCPLTSATEKIINSENIAKCKHGVWIINTGRGGLIDEQALATALKNGSVGYAGVDVLSVEPPVAENPLLSCSNCFITPHNAWTTQSARKRLIDTAINNFKVWVEGSPINVVN